MSKLVLNDITTVSSMRYLRYSNTERNSKTSFDNTKSINMNAFGEFDDDGFHLGDCSDLKQHFNQFGEFYADIVVFTIIVPQVPSSRPFIVFLVTKNADDEWVFPSYKVTNGRITERCDSFLHSFGLDYERIGIYHKFPLCNKPIAVYELKGTQYGCNLPCQHNTDTGCYEWVTPTDMIDGMFMSRPFGNVVKHFVCEPNNGLIRLYKSGKFIPSPSSVYTAERDINKTNEDNDIVVGDFNYGVITTFFNIYDNKVRHHTNVGRIFRMAYWDDMSNIEQYTLESPKHNCKVNLEKVKTKRNSLYLLSSHYGHIIDCKDVNVDAVIVLRDQLFIFD